LAFTALSDSKHQMNESIVRMSIGDSVDVSSGGTGSHGAKLEHASFERCGMDTVNKRLDVKFC